MKSIIITFVFILIVFSLHAQEKFDLEKCRNTSLENSYKIKIDDKRIESAEQQKEAVKRDFYPHIDAYGNYTYLQEPVKIEINNAEFKGDNNQYQLGVNITQPIYTGGYLKTKNKLSELNKQFAVESKKQTTDYVLFNTEITYWESVMYKVSIKNLETLKELIDELVKVVKDKVDNEVVSRNDLLMVEVKQNEVQLELFKTQNNYKVVLMELNRIMGLDVNKSIDVDESLLYAAYIAPTYESIDAVLVNRPEWSIQKTYIDINSSNIEMTKSYYRPNVMVGVVPYWGDPNTNLTSVGPMYNTAVMANISVPIFEWGKKKHLVSEKTLEMEASKIGLDDLKENISYEVNSALYRIQESIERIKLTEQSVVKAQENVDVITERYNSGLTPIIEVLDAQANWLRAYDEGVKAKVNYFQSLAVYKKSIGELI
jgi:outer membrane protein TolC